MLACQPVSQVLKHLSPFSAIYENVRGAGEPTTSKDGETFPPAIQVVAEDAEQMGYQFAPSLTPNNFSFLFDTGATGCSKYSIFRLP